MAKTPTLLAINAGVSLQRTVVLPITFSPKVIMKSMISFLVNEVGIISNKFKYLAGLKK